MATKAVPTRVEFSAEGTKLRGLLYLPENRTAPCPAVAMAHGFAGLKEMGLLEYAERFAEAGLAVLVYDHRNCGESEGTPRLDFDPVAQWRDYSAAVTYLQSREEINPARIGVWGTSYSGGAVLAAAALDKRIKCVVTQVPLIDGYRNILQLMPLQQIDDLRAMIDADRVSRMQGNPPALAPICAGEPGEPCIFPGRRTYDFYMLQKNLNPEIGWENLVTVKTLEYILEYNVTSFVPRISPTPLLMIVASEDRSTPTDISLEAFETALEPKKLVLVNGDHYRSYLEEFPATSAAARDWFVEHLMDTLPGNRAGSPVQESQNT